MKAQRVLAQRGEGPRGSLTSWAPGSAGRREGGQTPPAARTPPLTPAPLLAAFLLGLRPGRPGSLRPLPAASLARLALCLAAQRALLAPSADTCRRRGSFLLPMCISYLLAPPLRLGEALGIQQKRHLEICNS